MRKSLVLVVSEWSNSLKKHKLIYPINQNDEIHGWSSLKINWTFSRHSWSFPRHPSGIITKHYSVTTDNFFNETQPQVKVQRIFSYVSKDPKFSQMSLYDWGVTSRHKVTTYPKKPLKMLLDEHASQSHFAEEVLVTVFLGPPCQIGRTKMNPWLSPSGWLEVDS